MAAHLKSWDEHVEAAHVAIGGKRTQGALYLHRSAAARLTGPLATVVRQAATVAGVGRADWSVVKFSLRRTAPMLSFLDYPHFEAEPTPALARSTSIDLATATVRRMDFRDQQDRTGAPDAWIMHRKEETLALADPRRAAWARETDRLERKGAFAQKTLKCIGRRSVWKRVLAKPKANGRLVAPRVCVADRTAIPQVPALLRAMHRAGVLPRGTVNVDVGGGPYPHATKYLAARGVRNVVYDCVLPAKEQAAALRTLRQRNADSATLANVLNVIDNPATRREVLALAAASVRPRGRVWIAVHDGNRTGRGRVTSKGWQENRAVNTYLVEVRRVLPRAELTTIGHVRAIVAVV